MEDVMAESIWQPRLYALLFAVFAGAALLLAVIGIYGVMAYLVIRRTHEIGVRMALGATARDVFKLIVGRGMMLTTIGVLLGIRGALALTRLMRGMLFNISATDPATFILIPVLLVYIAFIPFWFLLDSEGQTVVRDHIRPKRIIAVHISPAQAETVKAQIRQSFPDAVAFTTLLEKRKF